MIGNMKNLLAFSVLSYKLLKGAFCGFSAIAAKIVKNIRDSTTVTGNKVELGFRDSYCFTINVRLH